MKMVFSVNAPTYMYLSITDDLQVGETLETRNKQMRKVAAKKAFARPVKKL
jgi:hypothetical protein